MRRAALLTAALLLLGCPPAQNQTGPNPAAPPPTAKATEADKDAAEIAELERKIASVEARKKKAELRQKLADLEKTEPEESPIPEKAAQATEAGESNATDAAKTADPAAKTDEIPGFSLLRHETFAAGAQEHTVKVYRNETFAQALRLEVGKTDVACEFVLIPGGTFSMGSPDSEAGRDDDEGPQRKVNVKPFLLARTELTQGVWERVMGNYSSFSPRGRTKGARLPVERVAGADAASFCQKTGLRLPSEAEWEYACRSGTTSPFAFGPTITTDQVNYGGTHPYGNAPIGPKRGETTDVGTLLASSICTGTSTSGARTAGTTTTKALARTALHGVA
jgi:formylglycine-generating enzyme required for sulfatase activity